MFLKNIVQALERIESGEGTLYRTLEIVLREQKKIEQNQKDALRNQKEILDRLAALEKKGGQTEKPPDEWIQQGIDNIMNYQVGKKREDSR